MKSIKFIVIGISLLLEIILVFLNYHPLKVNQENSSTVETNFQTLFIKEENRLEGLLKNYEKELQQRLLNKNYQLTPAPNTEYLVIVNVEVKAWTNQFITTSQNFKDQSVVEALDGYYYCRVLEKDAVFVVVVVFSPV